MTGNLNLNNNSIINLKNPVNKTDAVTKEYIDNKFSNLPNLDNIVTTESGMEIILPDSAINTPY